jgi:hypothetical protein
VYRMMRQALGALVLALCVGVPAVQAQDDRQTSTGSGMAMSGSSGMMAGNRHMDWSHRYMLTPIEHKRLRALGLSDDEVFAAANAAEAAHVHLDAPTLDNPAQMLLRGMSYWEIARQLNIPTDVLNRRKPEWETAEWRQGVDEGWFAHRQGMTTQSTTTERR